jgi:hypothetical protein
VTINQALRPVEVSDYVRQGQTVKGVSRTKPRQLSSQERMLIENFARKGKGASKTIKEYYASGLSYRSPESIKKHYLRIKKKI